MTITIHLPTGTSWGPGIQFDWSTNFIGPFPSGTRWTYGVFPGGLVLETALVGSNKISQQSRETGVLGSPINGWPVFTPEVAAPEGAQATVDISILPPTGPAIDQIAFQVTWAPTSAVYALQTQAQGGLTPDQAAQLQRIEDNQQTNTPVPTRSAELVDIPAFGHWITPIAPFRLEGRAATSTPTGLGFQLAIGLWLQRVNAPPELGQRDGFVITYRERVAQLILYATLRGLTPDVPMEFFDLHTQSALWLFKSRNFHTLAWDVLPGCTIDCQWVTISQGPT